ncbi:hypothetical protein H6F75_14495 [Nodosilinea sp. FACHB-131]|uniref:hypothetical protein n=1 Tax=Cyanophyceae TaxID=3028117 RepID=UPI001681C4CD|nr:hypothetical protein [Nodosilinea sp. FACHB-131]MBD1874696.1 hypothetical protein [Nodosilinea sp. FACHB-131]
MISHSFPWGEGRRNAILDGGLGPAKWPQQQIWLSTPIVRRLPNPAAATVD